MNAREIIAQVTNPRWTKPGPTLDHIHRRADDIIAALRAHPEAVRSLLSDELLADIRLCAEARQLAMAVVGGSPIAGRVLAWLDGEQ